MKIFLDTSSLFKLYHREADTADKLLQSLFIAESLPTNLPRQQ